MTTLARAILLLSNTDDLILEDLPPETLKSSFEQVKRELANIVHRDGIAKLAQVLTELERGARSTALTYQSSSYLKAAKWQEAIKDAEKAVQLAPESPDGYFQLAACYLSQNEVHKALMCYVNAAECVPPDNVHHRTVLTRKHLLEEGIREQNSLILRKVPHEIFSRIFSYLIPKDYTKCMETCKSWYEFFKNLTPERLELRLVAGTYPNFCRVKPAHIRCSLRKLELSLYERWDAITFLISSGCCRIESIGEYVKRRGTRFRINIFLLKWSKMFPLTE